MARFRVYLTRIEVVEVECENEDDAFDEAIDECEGYGELTSHFVEEIEEDED
jgi:hypothetical protein